MAVKLLVKEAASASTPVAAEAKWNPNVDSRPQPQRKSTTNLVEYSVSELAFALKRTVEEAYGLVRLRGEISGFKGQHASGHCYFALKDEKAAIEAVIWRSTYQRLKFKPEEGLEVIVKGRVTTYPDSSKYQIVIDELEPAGIGALMALLEQRKRAARRRGPVRRGRASSRCPICRASSAWSPRRPGAVIRDILHRLADRFPCHVLVWPVRVQGETCAVEVAAAIHGFNALIDRRLRAAPRPDHRRARRRQPRGPLGLQRGDRRPRRRREHHPADLRGRARDRLDPHRSRRRSPRADADRGRRARRAGARRPAYPGDELRLARHELPQAAGRGPAAHAARRSPADCRAERDPGPAAPALRRRERAPGPRAARQCAAHRAALRALSPRLRPHLVAGRRRRARRGSSGSTARPRARSALVARARQRLDGASSCSTRWAITTCSPAASRSSATPMAACCAAPPTCIAASVSTSSSPMAMSMRRPIGGDRKATASPKRRARPRRKAGHIL